LGVCSYPGGDLQLLSDVLQIPNVKVIVVHGTKDAIVPSSMIQAISDRFPSIPCITLDGQGHDPFEEQVDVFVSKLSESIT